MSTKIQWMEGSELPQNQMVIAAVPGVGNVGKLVIDTLNEQHESTMVARLIHPDLPPHSVLEEGLLVPPHLSVHSVQMGDAKPVITITGNGQPMTPRGQHELAETILQLAEDSQTPMVLVLAGLSAKPGEEHIHLTCSSKDVQSSLNERGISVSTEQPSGGMLGLAGLLVSLSTLHVYPVLPIQPNRLVPASMWSPLTVSHRESVLISTSVSICQSTIHVKLRLACCQ